MREWFTAAWKIAAGAVSEYRRPRGAVLDQIAERLGVEAEHNQVIATRHGVRVMLRFGTRGSGSDATPWTEIEAELPPAYPLEIHVWRRTPFDRERTEQGILIDIGLGDPLFGQAFVVEAAPEGVARMLLDDGARRMLSAHQLVTLDTASDGERRVLRLAIRTWVDQVSDAIFALDQVARICAGVRDAYALLDGAEPVRMDGAPYRPMPNDQPARDASGTRAAEVAALQAVRSKRQHWEAVMVAVLFVVIVLCVVAERVWGH